jgi:hypothetical protein
MDWNKIFGHMHNSDSPFSSPDSANAYNKLIKAMQQASM